jgi:hypothetical protein
MKGSERLALHAATIRLTRSSPSLTGRLHDTTPRRVGPDTRLGRLTLYALALDGRGVGGPVALLVLADTPSDAHLSCPLMSRQL